MQARVCRGLHAHAEPWAWHPKRRHPCGSRTKGSISSRPPTSLLPSEALFMRPALSIAFLAVIFAVTVRADGPADNIADKVRPVPPKPKDAVSMTEKAELQKGVNELGAEIESLRTSLKDKPDLLALLPDVQIFHNAVRYALTYDEI